MIGIESHPASLTKTVLSPLSHSFLPLLQWSLLLETGWAPTTSNLCFPDPNSSSLQITVVVIPYLAFTIYVSISLKNINFIALSARIFPPTNVDLQWFKGNIDINLTGPKEDLVGGPLALSHLLNSESEKKKAKKQK